MHKKHAKDGLVTMSVNLDDPKEEKTMENVRQFLKEQQAAFPNFVLNEAPEVWQNKLDISGPPVVFIFGRNGELAKKFDPVTDYKEIEEVAAEQLKKK